MTQGESETLRSIADAVPAALWSSDRHGRRSFVGGGWRGLVGGDASGPADRRWLDAVHPDDRGEAERRFLAAVARGAPLTQTYRMRRNDGGVLWVQETMRPRSDDAGRLVGYAGAIVDVGDLRAGADALRERAHASARLDAFRRSVLGLVDEVLEANDVAVAHRRVLERAIEVIPGAEAGAILVRDDEGDGYRFDAAVGYDLEHLGTIRIPVSATAFGHGFEGRTPRIVKASQMRPELPPGTERILRAYGRLDEIRVALVVPIFVDGRETAHLTLDAFASDEAFGEESVEMARVFAGHVAALLQRRSLESELRRTAYEDALTGLPNRAWFRERLDRTLHAIDGYRTRAALVFVDLDNLKPVNDSLGHWAGDRVLREVADRLRACARPSDVMARMGGDEFTVLLEGPSVGREARALAERILHAFNDPIRIDEHEASVTASIGIALHPSDGVDAEELVRHADIAMYHAKLGGKNDFAFFTPAMQAAPLERLMLEQALREALDRNEFVLEYQPRVDLRDGRVVAVEALVRWDHPRRGRIPPGAFVPLAESTALVHPLGRRILQLAVAQASEWRDRGLGRVRVAVNLSTRQVQHRELVDEVREVLASARLPASALEFEVLESAAMNDVSGGVANLWALKRLGARVALDDFGTGYSSLAYLRDLPIDALKIDRSFVARLHGPGGSDADLAIVRAIGSLGRELGLRVVAEGIEHHVQLRRARDAGCGEAQGFLLGRPVPASEIEPILRSGAIAV